MVSGIPTASGYEERIRFSEMEVVDRGANDQGLLINMPEGNYINGWDVNVAGVRTTSVKRTVRYHQHAVRHSVFLLQKSSTNGHRNSSSVLSDQVKKISLWAEDMESLRDFTSVFEQNFQERSWPHCPARIRAHLRPSWAEETTTTLLQFHLRLPKPRVYHMA